MNRRSEDALAEGLVGLGVIIALVLALVGIWLVVQAINLVIQQLAAHPDNKPLWIALGSCVALGLLVAMTGGHQPLLFVPWSVSALTLVGVARIVELYYDAHLQTEDALVDQVLHQPWWGD